MKITNKSVYALKFMLHVALQQGNKPVSVSEVANKESISEKFLESIVSQIKTKGLLKVKRGAKGGYFLAKPASKTAVKDIIESVENDFLNFSYKIAETNTTSDVILKTMFSDIDMAIIKYLENKSLHSMVEKYEAVKSEQMYYI